MYGISLPPSASIAPQSIMGDFWSNKLMGVIRGWCSSMESHIYKLLLSDGLFSNECREEYLDIVKVVRGDGYAALHKILRLHDPRLVELIVEVKYSWHTVTIRYGEHVKLIQQCIDHESMCGRFYMRYDAL
jgi:hypothetical protein